MRAPFRNGRRENGPRAPLFDRFETQVTKPCRRMPAGSAGGSWSLTRSASALQAKKLDGQAIKGTRWMPWRWEAMKDAVDSEMPRVAVKQALIRGSPNGATRRGLCRAIPLLNT